jgi:hypothetical protein
MSRPLKAKIPTVDNNKYGGFDPLNQRQRYKNYR